MRARVVVLLCLFAACKKDNHFTDAAPAPDARQTDGGSTLPMVEFPASFDLGAGDCGGDVSITFDAENTGGGDLTFQITPSSSIFEVNPVLGTILAGTTTTFTVTAHVPADATPGTAVTGELSFITNLSSEPLVIPVSADPRGGVISLDPGSAGFGDVELGDSAQQTVTVHNDGNAAVSVQFGQPTVSDYGIAFTAGTLNGGAQRDATATFTPGGLGSADSSAALVIDGAVCGAAPSSLTLSGNGLPIGSVLVTGNAAYGSLACGTAGTDSRTITLDNRGALQASWTAAFLSDAEGDDAYYQLSAASGTVNGNATTTIDITRLAIPLPTTPGAHDATLRIITTVAAVPTQHDIPVTQQLSGAVLAVGPGSFDYGFAPVGQILSRSYTVTNSGNASATATYTESGTPFSVPQTGATIAGGGGTGTFDAAYAPSANGIVTGNVTVTAPGACQNATLTLDGGNGPWLSAQPSSVSATCDTGAVPVGIVTIVNLGPQLLTVSGCTEITSTGMNPSFSPDPLNVPGTPGAASQLTYSWSPPSPLVSGTTTATIQCNVNEKFYSTKTFPLSRTMNGGDLTLAPVSDLAFSCGDAQGLEKHVLVTNNGNQSVLVNGTGSVPSPLFVIGGSFLITNGGGTSTVLGVGVGSSGCAPGTGSVGVGSGSGSGVCSITPSWLPVTLSP